MRQKKKSEIETQTENKIMYLEIIWFTYSFQTEVNYENVKELPYFDMVFDEVCRLYPTASL